MSEGQAKACVVRMKTDEAFRARVMAVADVAARTSLLRAEGFDCSAEEVEAVSAELADAELDRVSGGMGVTRLVVTDGHINAKTN